MRKLAQCLLLAAISFAHLYNGAPFISSAEYLVYDDGYRRWTHSYSEVAESALAFATRLQKAGVGKADRIILWCENRPEWLFAFWGCVLAGIVVVPIGSEASADFVQRIKRIIQPRLID